MMVAGEPFDAEPDPDLGLLLRRQFDTGDDRLFAARVLAGLPERANQWEVLARWARPGIAAACLGAALTGYWLGLHQAERSTPDAVAEVAATDQPSDGAALLSVVLAPEP